VRDFFLHFFKQDADFEQYLPFVRDTYLKHAFAESKLVNGVGDAERWYSMLSTAQVKALQERIDLDFTPVNKVFYKASAPVSLKVNVKNVKKLIVRVFEINTFNFYSRNLHPVNTAINLDGLAATREQAYNYDERPLRRVERNFNFPELKKRGVYVVEFIGNGRSSRALISKGNLHVLEDTGSAGHEFRVLDEDNKDCPQATLWLSGNEYKAGKDAKLMPCGACVLQHVQVALADERPATAAITDKFHHINATLFEFRKIKVALDAPQGALIVVISLLTRGCQTI
jgi:hypothetical protein